VLLTWTPSSASTVDALVDGRSRGGAGRWLGARLAGLRDVWS